MLRAAPRRAQSGGRRIRRIRAAASCRYDGLRPDPQWRRPRSTRRPSPPARRERGEPAVMGGVCYVGASIAGPGVIRHIGKMQRLVFGEYDGRRSARAEALLEACTRGGIDAEFSADIKRAIWEKFVFLVAMSGATSSIRRTIGPIRQNPRTRAFFLDL